MKFVLSFAALCITLSSVFAQWKPDATLKKKIDAFDAYVQKAQKEWDVPGMAVAVVKDGHVLLSKGYGVREFGKADVVDSKTLFVCASTTKAMTAACMGMLVDEGKVSWDDAVQKHLPDFILYDPYVTKELKIRDLFTHNTGVGNADFLWGAMNISSDDILKRMRDVKPSYSLRSGFIYQNIFYLAAGKVIEKVSGKSWNDFVTERIFTPLGMSRTVPLYSMVKDVNMSKPHFRIDDKITVITHSNADPIGPAGSVWSCADDIAKWTMVMLDSGKYAGGRLLKAASWVEMFKPQVIVPADEFYPSMQLTKPNWTTYSLGWFQHDYKGRKVNFHTGSLDGATAIHAQLPDENLGIYIFGNLDHAEARHALIYKAFDHFALGGTRDWSVEFQKLYAGIKEKNEKTLKEFESKRVSGTTPSHEMESYTGKYSDPLYGELTITLTDNKLHFNLNDALHTTFGHWHYDTFRGDYDEKWYGKGTAEFTTDATGMISKVNFEGLEFERKKEEKE